MALFFVATCHLYHIVVSMQDMLCNFSLYTSVTVNLCVCYPYDAPCLLNKTCSHACPGLKCSLLEMPEAELVLVCNFLYFIDQDHAHWS